MIRVTWVRGVVGGISCTCYEPRCETTTGSQSRQDKLLPSRIDRATRDLPRAWSQGDSGTQHRTYAACRAASQPVGDRHGGLARRVMTNPKAEPLGTSFFVARACLFRCLLGPWWWYFCTTGTQGCLLVV
jgi:hypothetical protein